MIHDADPRNEQELQHLLDAERTTRAKACHDEIKIVLERYRCQLIAFPRIETDGHIVAVIQIAPL